MKEFVSRNYNATVDDDGILTVMNEQPVIRQTTWGPGGEVKVVQLDLNNATGAERDLLLAKSRSPAFMATWAGNRRWNVDIDCGAQRFNGTKTNGELIKALKGCGFGLGQINMMLSKCKKAGKQDYAPRHW